MKLVLLLGLPCAWFAAGGEVGNLRGAQDEPAVPASSNLHAAPSVAPAVASASGLGAEAEQGPWPTGSGPGEDPQNVFYNDNGRLQRSSQMPPPHQYPSRAGPGPSSPEAYWDALEGSRMSFHEVGYRSPEWWRQHRRHRHHPRHHYHPPQGRWAAAPGPGPSTPASAAFLAFPPAFARSSEWGEPTSFSSSPPRFSEWPGSYQHYDQLYSPQREAANAFAEDPGSAPISMPEIGYRSPEWWREHRHHHLPPPPSHHQAFAEDPGSAQISMPEIGYRSPEWWREHRHHHLPPPPSHHQGWP